MFLDEAVITVRSGAGGDGCISFRREKYIPRGGPDGGDGGRGGNVYLQARSDLATLIDVSRRPIHRAEDGRPGSGSNRAGRNAPDLTIGVPVGTIVREVVPGRPPREGPLLGDLLEDGQELRVARGGKGGRGNKAFATSTHQAPREREEGQPGEERRLYLELKLIADVGLIGLPNVGKSTLLSRLSRATPKIADYPFTTLNPHLGLVDIGDHERLVFADIPGLIEGAHRGVGLGIEFLRHVERTSVLIHLVSCEPQAVERMAADYRTVEAELESYSESLASKPRLVVVTKLDLLPAGERDLLVAGFSRAAGVDAFPLSAVTGLGVEGLLRAAASLLTKTRRLSGMVQPRPDS